jgi:hypothetical protein
LGDINGIGAIRDRRLWQESLAFEWETGCLPFGESAFEAPHLGVACGAKFFHGGGGIERSFTRAINDKRGGRVNTEGLALVEETRLIDTGIPGGGKVGCGVDVLRQDLDELRGRIGLEERMEFAGVHKSRGSRS